jgi:hypothetical protein
LAVCDHSSDENLALKTPGGPPPKDGPPGKKKGNEMEEKETKQAFVHENGATYFSKQTERKIFFVLTLVMLGWGIVEGMKKYLG